MLISLGMPGADNVVVVGTACADRGPGVLGLAVVAGYGSEDRFYAPFRHHTASFPLQNRGTACY